MIKKLIKEIKKKKTLSSLSDEFVEERIEEYFRKNLKIKKKLEKKSERSEEFKKAVKEIRKKLHEIYGIFDLGKRDLRLSKEELMGKHRSTAERLDNYKIIYKKIFSEIGEVKSILDLGSGLNPLSYEYLGFKPRYYAVELTKEDCEFLNEFFKKEGIEGKAVQMDLLHLGKLPKTDVCFMFKILDGLESIKKDISEEILGKIKAKWMVVSFPTRSICGGKRIGERGWFLKLLRKMNLKYEIFETENERFYVIEKFK